MATPKFSLGQRIIFPVQVYQMEMRVRGVIIRSAEGPIPYEVLGDDGRLYYWSAEQEPQMRLLELREIEVETP